mgnify:CR=1 FL=1|tara:strand:- start:11845 stop:12324 length:480 start_codon:yes stop_codon:yes gene_type:complete
MPLYEYRCCDCNKVHEEILSINDPEPVECGVDTTDYGCGGSIYRLMFAPSAHTSWNTTGRYGADGYYSKALGTHVDSPHKEKKIMESRGFVCEADLPKHRWDDAVEAQKQRVEFQDKCIDTYTTALDNGKTKEEAVVEAFTAEDALSGKLEKAFAGESK